MYITYTPCLCIVLLQTNYNQLRCKIVNYGYDLFLKTGKMVWTHPETPEVWRKKMSRPYEWGDDVALQLASNVLGVDVVLIPAFKESAYHRDVGITIIRSIEKNKREPLYLFYYSESDFCNPHFQSIFPRCRDNVVKTYLEQNDDRVSLSHSEPHPVSFSLTEESIQDIPIVLESQSFHSIQVITNTSVGENPVSVMAQEVVPEKRRRGRPPGSKI